MTNIENIIKKQRAFFDTHKTKDVNFRIEQLKKLKQAIQTRENDICKALEKDLGKSSTEAYMAEIGMVLEELSYVIKHTKKWSKREYHLAPIAQFPSTSFRIAEPYRISANNVTLELSISTYNATISRGAISRELRNSETF